MVSRESQLINELMSKTTNGSIGWETTAEGGEFVVTFGGGIAVSIMRVDVSDGPDFIFRILDRAKGEVLRIQNGGFDVSYQDLQHLHEQAKRNAFNVDTTLDAILTQLKGKE